MDKDIELHVVYEDGVLKPEEPLNMPERTRLLASLRETPKKRDDRKLQAELAALRAKGTIRLNGWKFNRDELYERD